MQTQAFSGVSKLPVDLRTFRLTHYYEKTCGPFRSLSTLPRPAAEQVLNKIRRKSIVFAGKRPDDYIETRRMVEKQMRRLFIECGGKPKRYTPHYLIVGECSWVKNWYREGQLVSIPLHELSPDIVSLTYGDSFPSMRYYSGKPYSGQVYTLEDLPLLIHKYGLPQEWNPDGANGPERYIEAQVWADDPILPFLPGNSGG
jgi:hypothetical protein